MDLLLTLFLSGIYLMLFAFFISEAVIDFKKERYFWFGLDLGFSMTDLIALIELLWRN